MVKKACLIPEDGEYRLKRLRSLGRICKGIGNATSGASKPKRGTPAGMRWGICKDR